MHNDISEFLALSFAPVRPSVRLSVNFFYYVRIIVT